MMLAGYAAGKSERSVTILAAQRHRRLTRHLTTGQSRHPIVGDISIGTMPGPALRDSARYHIQLRPRLRDTGVYCINPSAKFEIDDVSWQFSTAPCTRIQEPKASSESCDWMEKRDCSPGVRPVGRMVWRH